ncbi:DUF559 domain-containing protein [Candidatus Gracilibacteria bacterium]|nr:DUF559 domain-containing protein [Candidatus Gracilibacteria bacterium]
MNTLLTKSLLHTTDAYIKGLAKAGIETVGDLLLQFPRDYEDRTDVLDSFSLINVKEKNTILVKLLTINNQKTANNKLLTKAVFEDKNGFLAEAVWFNRKYLSSQLKSYEQKKVIVSGKVKYAFGKVTFQSPEVETDLSKVAGSIVPIYSDLNYIPSKWTSGKIELLKKHISSNDEGILPENIIQKYDFISRGEAIHKIHFPRSQNDIDQAKQRLAYEELFEINYKAISAKYKSFAETRGRSMALEMDPDLIKDILTKLPFDLTDHQKIALFQVLKDMEKDHAMQRLLEGDVGTGKTIVAVVAIIHAIEQSKPLLNPPLPGEEIDQSRKSTVWQNYYESKKYVVDNARELRKKGTKSEDILWEFLRRKQLGGFKFRRQHPFGRYIADFYNSDSKIVIELDGEVHEKTKEYDTIRDKIIQKYGVKVIRVKNEEVEKDIDIVLQKILDSLSPERGKYPKGDRGSIQVAIMAPTEILARQHFNGVQNLLFEFGISSQLLVGSTTGKNKKAIKADLKSGNLDVVIGTHALVQEDVYFNNLGFVIIDEQHRFGVKQREVLEQGFGNSGGIIPHSLNMTATPIPRTLALTLYGDQDLSIISQYPKGRKDIYTKVAKNQNARAEIELWVRAELEKGRQVFWVSPLVEESEKMDLANAISTYESLVDIFHPFRVGLLHGKMKAAEKAEIMKEFSENKIQILSSTSVIEVGVDVPNATIMCIEGAERFGLSQLHQFRGRVGRGQHQSYCYLFPTKAQATDRLKAMERTNNGFELSEIDLEIRGPGEVYGLRQSGVPDLKVASLTDLELISQIREDIEEMFEEKKK